MHFHDGQVPVEYRKYIAGKVAFLGLLLLLFVMALIAAISLGAAEVRLGEVVRSLIGQPPSKQVATIVWNIRLPQALAAAVAGAGLAVAGAAMQSILRNPLGSPFTLGISHAAAFGAALSVMILGGGVMTSGSVGAVHITNPYLTTFAAFVFSMLTSCLIIAIARLRGATPEIMVLTGVALGAFFTAGTMFLQFFADDVQLAAMVFWTFGDTARANWNELLLMALVTVVCRCFFSPTAGTTTPSTPATKPPRAWGCGWSGCACSACCIASLLTAVSSPFSASSVLLVWWCPIWFAALSVPTTVFFCRHRQSAAPCCCSLPTPPPA
jgi:iron complex transport system permease protein